MAKLLVALYLLCGGAHAMGIYGGEKNGCGEPCAEIVTINSPSIPTIESGTCYVVDGTIATVAEIPADINCAKITIPSGSSLNEIAAHLPRPSHGCPAKR